LQHSPFPNQRFDQGNLSKAPLTEALVRKVPKIKFPVEVTISNEKPNRLLDRFNQAQKP
jgi:hypothetical protein